MKAYVKGKNLLLRPYNQKNITKNGVTFTENKDGSITANGIATAKAILYLHYNDPIFLPNKELTLSGCPENQSGIICYTTFIKDGSQYKVFINRSAKPVTFTTEDNCTYSVCIMIPSGITVENLVFKLQIEEGTVATEYEPYAAPEEITIPQSVEVNGEEIALRFAKIDDYADKLVVDVTNQKVTYTQNIYYFKCTEKTYYHDRTSTYFTDGRRWFQVGNQFPYFIPGKGLCTILNQTSSDYGDYNHLRIMNSQTYGLIGFILQGFDGTSDFKEYTLSHDVIVQAPLETPIEYDLTDTKLGQKLLTIVKNNKGYVGAKYYTANPNDKSELIAVECNDVVTLSSTLMEVQGNTEQPIYEGKNLVDVFNRTEGTLSGGDNTTIRNFEFDKYYVGLSANNYYYPHQVSNETIKDNGWEYIVNSSGYGMAFPVKCKSNTTYALSAIRSNSEVYVRPGFFTKNGEYLGFLQSSGVNGSFTTPENCEILIVSVSGLKSETPYLVQDIQLEEGTTATSYEPYVGGVPIPNPEQPQDIVNIGDHRLKVAMNSVKRKKMAIYKHGKNLFDITKAILSVGRPDWSAINNSDGSITLFGYNATVNKPLSYFAPSLKVGNTYTLSLKTEGANKFIYLNGSRTIWHSGTSRTLTRAEIDGTFNVYGEHDKTITSWDYQIEEGTVVTEYEPYNSPNLLPYPYYYSDKVTAYGITSTVNLDRTITLNGTCTAPNVADYYLAQDLKLPAGIYTLSGCPIGGGTYLYRQMLAIKHSDGRATTYSNDMGSGVTFTLVDGDLINISIRYGKDLGIVKNLTFKPMLVKGDTATKYEPYGRKRHKMKVIRRGGKNLWDYKAALIAAGGVLQEDGSVKVRPGQVYNKQVAWYPLTGDKQVTMTVTMKNENPDGKHTTYPMVWYTDGSTQTLAASTIDAYQKYKTTSFSTIADRTIECIGWGYNYGENTYIKDVQIEYGDTATEYEPFKIV